MQEQLWTSEDRFSGVPFFHSIIARAGASSSNISILIDAQFILTRDFLDTIVHAYDVRHDWLLVAMARSSNSFPFQLRSSEGPWMNENGQLVRDEQVQAYIKVHGKWQSCTGKYLWAWNAVNIPLHVGVMPSFVYGYGSHHEWLLNEALSSGFRFVFDASDALTVFYLSQYEGVSRLTEDTWEAQNNAHLAALYGSFFFKPVDFVNTPPKLVKCGDSSLKAFRFLYPLFSPKVSADTYASTLPTVKMQDAFLTSFRRFGLERRHASAARYPCYQAEVKMKVRGHLRNKLIMGRLKVTCDCSNNRAGQVKLDCPFSQMSRLPKLVPRRPWLMVTDKSMPMSLDSLLAKVSSIDNIVVVSVVGNNYREMLMNWVCRLRKLQITNFVIGAVDTELFEFAVLQGLPVFMTGSSMNLSFNDCHFGTECFKMVTKVKSRTVLQILKLGYSVLFSDVDVYWFKDPMTQLMSFGPGVIAAQSDEWNITEDPNRPRRLNSGFYFAWSDPPTIAVFEKIVKHAALSNMSEQPSFYDVLCGESGRYRQGKMHCQEPDHNVITHFLDRELFPNGAFHELWDKKNVSEACILQGCYVLHNNWVSGRQRKFDRQITSGLWDYDATHRICLRSWHGPRS